LTRLKGNVERRVLRPAATGEGRRRARVRRLSSRPLSIIGVPVTAEILTTVTMRATYN
jgi:hypothetical protein